MKHVLIIGHDCPDADRATIGLWDAGYRSILPVRDPEQARRFVRTIRPDLILALPNTLDANAIPCLRAISDAADAPIIVATSDIEHAMACLGPMVSLEGPLGFDELNHIDRADAAVAPTRQLRAA